MRRKRRARFSLLELLVCIALLSVIAAIVGFKGKSLMDHHRFGSSVQEVKNKLSLCKSLAMTYQTDCQFCLFAREGKVYYQITPDDPLLQQRLKTGPVFLAAVDSCLPKTVVFSSSGWLPQEQLEFTHKTQTQRIALP